MIERPPRLPGVSLVEAVLARWLVEVSGVSTSLTSSGRTAGSSVPH
jgi:hypothetical protein